MQNVIADPKMKNHMKYVQLLKQTSLSFILFAMLAFAGCSKNDEPSPGLEFPEMTSISITGSQKTFDVVVGFSQGVFRTPLQTGDLTEQSFRVFSTDGVASLSGYFVTQAAGQKSATLRVIFDEDTNGEEIITVQPFDQNSIYNSAGLNMAATQSKSISTSGIEREIINVKDDGNGTGTTTWTPNNIYILDGTVFVNEGQTLTIEAGTVIRGKTGQGLNASALIVSRGAKIIADGTPDAPIIFTAEADDLNGSVSDLQSGLWGGVIILGRAKLNTIPGEQHVEGIDPKEERGAFGGNDDSDNSGILRYVSIRHGGTDIGDGNEINGLTLGAVGYGTTIEFVEIFSNKDDGVEIFGGAAQLKNVITAFCGDDGFDYDMGYHGKGQFWLAVQGFGIGDRLGEHDGGTSPVLGQPYSVPDIYNTTYVGLPPGASRRMITFSSNSGGHYTNSIFYQQAFGIDIELLEGECSFTQFQNENLTLKNNLFYLISHEPWLEVSEGPGVDQQQKNEANQTLALYFIEAGNTVTDPGFILNGLTFDVIPSNNVSENMADYPADDWIQSVNYKGAFDPTSNWAEGWSLFSKYMN